MVALNFNATAVAPNAALEPVPSGTYDVMITASSEKPNSKNNGSYVELELTIQGGEFNGRKLFDRLNIKNESAKAVEIAYSTLSAICHVTGRYQIQDSGQLHGVPFKAVVARVARDDKPGEYSNDVKGYKDSQGNDPGKAAGGGAPQGGPQGGGAPNWAGQQQGGQPQVSQQPPQNNYGAPQGQAPQGGQPPQWAGAPAGQPQGQQQAPQGGQPGWAGGQPQGQAPVNNGQGTAPPHQGAGGQQYPDPAHQPQQAPQNGQQPNGQQPNGQQPNGQQPNGGAPGWAGQQPQGQAPQGQQQPQPNQQQGFQPGASAPWGQQPPQQ